MANIRTDWRILVLPTFTFAVSFALFGSLVILFERQRLDDARGTTRAVAMEMASSLQRQTDISLSLTASLAGQIRLDRERVGDNFDAVAANLLETLGSAVANLQLAPEGVVSQIYPLAGNERAIGHDLLADPNRRREALSAIESRRATLAGPFELVQGGIAVINRYPVFVNDENDQERFWGFAIALIHLERLLEVAKLDRLAGDSVGYVLSRTHPDTGMRQVFAGSSNANLREPISHGIEVPNGIWTLDVVPAGDLRPIWLQGLEAALVLAISALITFLLWQYVHGVKEVKWAKEKLEATLNELKATQGELIQSAKLAALGQLAGGLAHDFSNLLTPIINYSELALEDLLPSDDVRHYFEEIGMAADRGADLIRQLMTFSSPNNVERKVLDISEQIITVSSLLRRLIGEHIELVFLPGQGRTWINANATQMEQILVNLSINARDAMPDGGKLIIETSIVTQPGLDSDVAAGEYVRLSISDTGIGMNEEVRAHIFEPFFTTKEVGEGTGLGLSICFGIVKGYQGDIRVYSTPGHGSTFDIYMPLVKEPARSVGAGQHLRDVQGGSETILLVDDEPQVRRVVARVLRARGYEVLEASNGVEALRMADEHAGSEIDLLLTDIVMPLMGGRELARKIQRIHHETKVLYSSGYTDDATFYHDTRGSASFLRKPYNPVQLASKVRQVLEGKGAAHS